MRYCDRKVRFIFCPLFFTRHDLNFLVPLIIYSDRTISRFQTKLVKRISHFYSSINGISTYSEILFSFLLSGFVFKDQLDSKRAMNANDCGIIRARCCALGMTFTNRQIPKHNIYANQDQFGLNVLLNRIERRKDVLTGHKS